MASSVKIMMTVLTLATIMCCLPARAIVLGNRKERFFLAKTQETFKFAELQFLQAQLDAANRDDAYQCERVVLDSATGSTLLRLDFGGASDPVKLFENNEEFQLGTTINLPISQKQATTDSDTTVEDFQSAMIIPPSLARCEWVAEVLAFGSSASDLVQSLTEYDNGNGVKLGDCTGWVMDYLRMTDGSAALTIDKKLPYTLKTLLCAVAPTIRAPALLDPYSTPPSHQLLLIETMNKGMYLGRILWRCSPPVTKGKSPADNIISRWAKRPFQYSSAIHPTVAGIVIEILLDTCTSVVHRSSEGSGTIKLLDATCGSGTFLAFALASNNDRLDVSVEGWDVNPQCTEGTKRNLEHFLGEETTLKRCRLLTKDSSMMPLEKGGRELLDVDCVVANLPWGKNTINYVDQNVKILRSLRGQLKVGTPCIFVSKDPRLSNPKNLVDMGYEFVGEAMVPPPNFVLPKSRKKQKDDSRDGSLDEDEMDGKRQRITVTRTI